MTVYRPPMGFNTWNTFGEDINEEMIKEIADAMVDKHTEFELITAIGFLYFKEM